MIHSWRHLCLPWLHPYQVSHLDPPGSWPGGQMLTGNLAPPGSDYWGLVNVNIGPAS